MKWCNMHFISNLDDFSIRCGNINDLINHLKDKINPIFT